MSSKESHFEYLHLLIIEGKESWLTQKCFPLQLFIMQVSYSDHFANMWTKVTEETEVYANRSN